jgi:expansin (peptidoglycan-binding protein)
VPGLDEAWLRSDIACHQAHVAALGHVPMELAGDPTLLPGAQVDVEPGNGVVAVIVTEPTPDAAQRAVAMARAAAAPITAER